jgi:Protein of unknown function (DUF1579)
MACVVVALATTVCMHSPVLAQEPLPASARLAMPGDKHRWLEPLIGRWNVEMLVWPTAGAAPIVSKEMRATREWILGGRYLREELMGKFAGNESNRVGILSYNNLDERFELLTIDTFEPGQMRYASQVPGTSQRFSVVGESTEAGYGAKPTGRKRELRYEFEIENARNVQRIYVKYPGELEFLFVEQRFTRSQQ